MNAEVMSTDSSQSRQPSWTQLFGIPPQPAEPAAAPDRRPRKMTVEAFTADSLLSHAIEYVTDSREIPSGKVTELSPEDPEVQAVVTLMEARHRVYLDCPVMERRSVRGMLGLFKGPEKRAR